MTPIEALQILDQASSVASLTRADHVKVQQAVQTLKKMIDDAKPKEEIKK